MKYKNKEFGCSFWSFVKSTRAPRRDRPWAFNVGDLFNQHERRDPVLIVLELTKCHIRV